MILKQIEKLLSFVLNYDFQPGEEWKEIPGTIPEASYFVSNYGTVLSLYNNNPVIRKPDVQNGYLRVKINGKNKLVHRLVACAFIPNPKGKSDVHHKDRNKQNNNVLNLVWLTPEEHRKAHQKEKGKANENK